MSIRSGNTSETTTGVSRPHVSDSAGSLSASDFAVSRSRRPRAVVQWEKWDRRSERWGRLMIAAQAGESDAYDRLLRELDTWLRRFYARRLPGSAAEDAVLLHAAAAGVNAAAAGDDRSRHDAAAAADRVLVAEEAVAAAAAVAASNDDDRSARATGAAVTAALVAESDSVARTTHRHHQNHAVHL